MRGWTLMAMVTLRVIRMRGWMLMAMVSDTDGDGDQDANADVEIAALPLIQFRSTS